MIPVRKIAKTIYGELRVKHKSRRDVPNEGQPPGPDHQTPPDTTTDSSQSTSAITSSSDLRNHMKGFWAKHNDRPDVSSEGQPPEHDHQTPPDTTTDSSQPTSTTASSPDLENPTEGLEGVPNEPTLSGREESGQNEISSVLHQRSYTGNKPVIKSSVANTPCSNLRVDELLEKLNGILGTPYTQENLSESLQSTLKSCIERDYDFGTAYARLRPYWCEDASRHIVEDELNDQQMRKELLSNNKIVGGDAPPRRVWDLYANRVVPYWVVGKYPWAISHAWVNGKKLTHVMTPINQNQWPVPIPNDANLDLIRIEMLNLGAEYVWLDVLCMTQEVRKEEEEEFLYKRQNIGEELCENWKEKELLKVKELHLDELKVDVPTIGWVYQEAYEVVCYFSGLGRPLSLTEDDFESDRCWFNRAWTLQETNIAPITGGRTVSGDELPGLLDTRLEPLRFMRRVGFVFDILSKMQTRKYTNPVDRIAGLVYLFYSEYIPIYQPKECLEDAWTTLCNVTQDWFRADLFFFYPKPGDGEKLWRPSWNQLMAEETETLRRVLDHHTNRYIGAVQQGPRNIDFYEGHY